MQASETSCHRLLADGPCMHTHADLTRSFVLRDLLHRLGRDHLTFSSTGTACNATRLGKPRTGRSVSDAYISHGMQVATFYVSCSFGLPIHVRRGRSRFDGARSVNARAQPLRRAFQLQAARKESSRAIHMPADQIDRLAIALWHSMQ